MNELRGILLAVPLLLVARPVLAQSVPQYPLGAAPGVAALADAPPVQSGQVVQTSLPDWLPGTFTNVYVEGGDLRLQADQTSGSYESQAIQTPFGLNAALLQWHAVVATDQELALDLRSSVDGQNWSDWQLAITQQQSPGAWMSQLFVLRPFTSWIQYRVRFTAVADSPLLNDITLTYLNSMAGPSLIDLVGRVPPTGPPTLTPAPLSIAGVDWGVSSPSGEVERQQPRRVVVTEVHASADDPNSAATVRALQWVALNVLQQAELPFHFLLDGSGTIYQGPGSSTAQFPDTSSDVVQIALLADMEHEGLSEAAEASVTQLLGWLGDAFNLTSASVDVGAGAPQQLRDLLPGLRTEMDRATVRSRGFFAAGDTANGTERLSLYNPGLDEARATLAVLSPLSQERRSITVPAGQRVDLTLNSTVPISGPLGLEILADRFLAAERTQILGRELVGSTGASQPARAWYFGAASTADGDRTDLAILNPQERDISTTISLTPDAGSPISRTLTIAARSRQTVPLADLLPEERFGYTVTATEPIVAEQTLQTASGAANLTTGIADLSRRWLFAEGSTMTGYTTTLALLNPWPQQVAITLRVLSEDGTSLSRRYAAAPGKRVLVTLNDIVPDLPFAIDLQAERPIAAERVMAFDNGAGTTAGPGATNPATRWTFVEGSTVVPADEYLLVANPNRQSVDLDVAYVLADGRVEHHTYVVGATARLTIAVNADVPDQPMVSAIVTADRAVVMERTIYVNGVDGRGGETTLGIPGE